MEREAIHIGFDLDGVLIDHAQVKVDLAADLGITVKSERTNSAFLKDYFRFKDYRRLQQRLYDDPVTSLHSPLMAGALQTLQALRSANIRYTLVSRRQKPAWAERIMEHHGLRPRFFDDTNTYFVGKPEEKNHVALRTGITHYLDDEVKVLKHLLDVEHKFLMDPFGMYDSTDEYRAVRTHKEFLEALSL